MKKLALFLIIVMLINLTLAIDLEVKKIDKVSAIISELNEPAVYDFVITNNGPSDSFEIYDLVSVTMTPNNRFELPVGTTKIEVTASPSDEIRSRTGFFSFSYEIQGRKSGIFKDTLLMKIVSLSDALEIKTEPIKPTDSHVTIFIKNKENAEINDIDLEFSSIFFDGKKTISLAPEKNMTITIPLKKDFDKKTRAGNYIVKTEIQTLLKKVTFETPVTFLEKTGLVYDESSSGFIVKKTTLTKTNDGNIPATAEIEVNKNFISRLFTTNSPEPDRTERSRFIVTYFWKKNLEPSESLVVESTTNYTLPWILLLFVVGVTLFVRNYYGRVVSVEKHVQPVKTKGGEFALKVTLRVKSRKHVDNVQLIDSLPSMTNLYEKFGKMPDRFDHSTNRMYWNISSLQAGEERVYTYIMYSKLNIVGRFELPAATAVFTHESKNEESFSSKVVFAREI